MARGGPRHRVGRVFVRSLRARRRLRLNRRETPELAEVGSRRSMGGPAVAPGPLSVSAAARRAPAPTAQADIRGLCLGGRGQATSPLRARWA